MKRSTVAVVALVSVIALVWSFGYFLPMVVEQMRSAFCAIVLLFLAPVLYS